VLGLTRIDAASAADVAAIVAIGDGQPSEDECRAELVRPWSHAWVVRDEADAPLAFVVFWSVVDETHVLYLGTRADRRRRGLARALMGEVLAHGKRGHVRQVLLEVRRSNVAAVSLYESLGFKLVRVRASYYRDGEDALEMALHPDTAAPPGGDGARPTGAP
jgi:ribosomal-protein-alanine N-acetyltransferase